MKGTASLV